MKKYISQLTAPPIPQPRIFKIAVRSDANELGLVVAYPILGGENEANVRGQTKIFRNETDKLTFLANARSQGFRNFETVIGRVDTEELVLKELARRQKLELEEDRKKTMSMGEMV